MKYKKKPIVIDAIQWTGKDEDIYGFMPRYAFEITHGGEGVVIKTLEGHMQAVKGDYIIKGVKGEFYPVRKDIFEETYEKVK